MTSKNRTLLFATVGLSVGFAVTVTMLLIQISLRHARENELAEMRRLQAMFATQNERQAAQSVRMRSFEARLAEMERLQADARRAVEATLKGTVTVRFDRLRVAETGTGAYVCGEINTKPLKAKSALRREFIYSADEAEVGFAPAEKWREWHDRTSC